MNIAAGKYRTRVMIQRLKSDLTEDASGHIDEKADANFEENEPRWCRLIYARGTERLVGDQLNGLQKVLVAMRSDSVTRALTTADRIKIKETGDIFSIAEPPVDVGGERTEVEFVAIRKV